MNAIGLLLGLLVLSYVGSILVGGRTVRGFGLPSGAEYLLLGFLLGPQVLGVVNRQLISAFEPMLVVGAAWLGLVAGVGYGHVGRRRVRLGRAAVGVLLALLVATGVAAGVFAALSAASDLEISERLLLSLAAGAVSSETTRHAVRWVVERHGARGKLPDTLADYARASVMAPVIALYVLFAAAPSEGLASVPAVMRALTTAGIGVMLGLVAALLLGREFRRDESWGILLGTSLLAMGVASRLGLSALGTTFLMGLTINVVSPHRVDLKAMVAPTEKPVILPIAVMAGAFVDLEAAPFLPILVAVALGVRLVLELLRGFVLSLGLPSARPAGVLIGLGMSSTGPFTLAAALTIGLRFPGALGSSVVALAAASVLMGELLGPLMLRRALTLAGSIAPDQSETPPPPSVDPGRPDPEGAR